MFKMELESVVGDTFRQFVRGTEKTLLFSFDVAAHSYEEPKTFNARQSIHFLLYGPLPNGSVRTFFAEDGNCFAKAKTFKSDRWDNISNHDCCWLDAIRSKIVEVYFKMCERVNDDRLDAGFEKLAPKDIHTMAHTPSMDKLFEVLDVKYERDYEAEEDYHTTRWKVRMPDATLLSRGATDDTSSNSGAETCSSILALEVAPIPRAIGKD